MSTPTPDVTPDPEESLTDIQRNIHASILKGKGDGPLKGLVSACRYFAPSIHPFPCFLRFVYAGIPGNEDDDDLEFSAEELQQFKLLSKLVPFFKVALDACVTVMDSQPDLLTKLIKQMETASQEGRQHDIQTLRGDVLSYILEDSDFESPFARVFSDYRSIRKGQKQSSTRGWNHIDTANLLCPLSHYDEFFDNPSAFMDAVQDGTIKVTHSDLPYFLYEAGTEYDKENQSNGLLQGYFLVRVWRHIFTGPATALDGGIGAKCRARMFRLTTVTPRSIAYAAVLARMSISGKDAWSASDLNFNYKDFYNTIVGLLEDDDDDLWSQDTLAWWNAQIPELSTIADAPKRKKMILPNDDDEPVDIRKRLMEQRAASGYQTIKEWAKQRRQNYEVPELDHDQDNNHRQETAEQENTNRQQAEAVARQQEELDAKRHQAEATARQDAEDTMRQQEVKRRQEAAKRGEEVTQKRAAATIQENGTDNDSDLTDIELPPRKKSKPVTKPTGKPIPKTTRRSARTS